MLRVVNSEISREISVLTKKDSKVFQGHASDSGALLTFDWKEQSCDLQTLSPFLYSIFSKAVGLQSKKNLSCMMTSAAVLLYSRSQKLCQLQYILGLILDSCGLTKEGIQIIHDLGLSVSPSSLHKKKKALITQQKKSIAKVVTGYVEHVETNYEKDLEHLFMESNQPDRLLTQNDISLTVERPQDSNDEEDFGDVLMEADDQHGAQDMSMRLKDITGTLQNTLESNDENDILVMEPDGAHDMSVSWKDITSTLVNTQDPNDGKDVMEPDDHQEAQDMSTTQHDLTVENNQDTDDKKDVMEPNDPQGAQEMSTTQHDLTVENNQIAGDGKASKVHPIEILGDNLDITITPSHMTEDRQRKSLHWFLTIVKRKRVTIEDLTVPLPKSLPDISELPSVHWIPSQEQMDLLRDNMNFHICHILLKYVDFLKPVVKNFPKFITHEFLERMKQKSLFLNCDLVDASEISSQGMIEILEEVHKLAVPHARDTGEVLERIVFGGDVLTNERAFSAQKSMQNYKEDFKSLRSLIHRPEGLHREMNFLGGIYKLFYKESSSSSDKGGLYQLRNLINRRTVIGADEVTSNFRAHHQFIEDVTDAYIVGTFLDIMNMDAADAVPAKCPVFSIMSEQDQGTWISKAADEVIGTLKLCNFNPLCKLLKDMKEIDDDCTNISAMSESGERFVCAMCGKTYQRTSWMKKHLEKKHHWVFYTPASSEELDNPVQCFLTMSLLYRDTYDAYKMGDGERIVRNAFFEWLYAGPVNHTKYKIWLFRLICYVTCILTPSESFEYKWNQCVNLQGGVGKNIPNDNCVELQVKAIKSKLNTQGSNKSFDSAKAITMTTQVVDGIKSQLMSTTKTAKSRRSRPVVDKTKDITKILQCIRKYGVVKDMVWESFPKFQDPLNRIKSLDLHKWISSNKSIAKTYL